MARNVSGAIKLTAAIRARMAKAKRDVSGSIGVGYSAPYAVHVHDDLEAHHSNGQAKFLEQPMKELLPKLRAQVQEEIVAGVPPKQAFYDAARVLFRASQALVPVRTGTLKASGYVVSES